MSHEMVLSKTFTSQQAAFIRYAADGMELEQAAIASGYAPATAKDVGGQIRRQPAIIAAIQVEVAKRLAIGSAVSLKVLEDIRDNSKDERLRVACAKDLLNRAGFIAPKATEASRGADKPLNDMSTTELRALADKLEGELADRAKPVSSASAAPIASQAIEDII